MSWFSPTHSHLPMGRWSRKNVSTLFWTVLMGRYNVFWWKGKKEKISIMKECIDSHLPILTYPWVGGAEKTFQLSFGLYWWIGTMYLMKGKERKGFHHERMHWFSPTHSHLPLGRWSRKNVSTLFWTVLMDRYSVSWWKRKKEMVFLVKVWVDSYLPILTETQKQRFNSFLDCLDGSAQCILMREKERNGFHLESMHWFSPIVYLCEKERMKWFLSWQYELILTYPFSPTHG